MKKDMAVPMETKSIPSITIDKTVYDKIDDLKIGDEVKIDAIGRITRLLENKVWKDGKETNKKEYSASMDLLDIEIDNVDAEDRKEAEADDLNVKDYKKIKGMREKVSKIRDGE